jgi:hypothetical protein
VEAGVREISLVQNEPNAPGDAGAPQPPERPADAAADGEETARKKALK